MLFALPEQFDVAEITNVFKACFNEFLSIFDSFSGGRVELVVFESDQLSV